LAKTTCTFLSLAINTLLRLFDCRVVDLTLCLNRESNRRLCSASSRNDDTASSHSITSRAGVSPSRSYEGLYSSQTPQEGPPAGISLDIEDNDLKLFTGTHDDRWKIGTDQRKRSASALGQAGNPEPPALIDRRHAVRQHIAPGTTESGNRQFHACRSQPPNQSSPGDCSGVHEWASHHSEQSVSIGMPLQPETHPITKEQLINEVRGIYAGLVMVEKKCIEINRQQSISSHALNDQQWQALIALHRTLLHEHHDLFLASQHPSASPGLKRLAERYAMPARMWRYGIHSFLELLRHRLPASLDHMLTFIYMAYSMMALLLESVPTFEETWIECLGDLARYRMTVEESDMHDREIWSSVARYWYNKAADKSPDTGRIQHHLAVLARPNIIQQLFYYTKSLVSVYPFLNAKESVLLLFNPLLDPAKSANNRHSPLIVAFVSAHGILFTMGLINQYLRFIDKFLSLLDKYVGRVGAIFREQGVYIASSNYAAIFGYGQPNAIFPALFNQNVIQKMNILERRKSARQFWRTTVHQLSQAKEPVFADTNFTHSTQILSYASLLAFSTLGVILERFGDKNVLPNIHVSLAFIWCLTLVPKSMVNIQADIPWTQLVFFLNTLIRHDTDIVKIESEEFPYSETGTAQQLPEDFLIRGQAWSQLYYPEGFFEDIFDDEERSVELPSVIVPRTHRCLWLGVRVATVSP
jgi:hypothetical protein